MSDDAQRAIGEAIRAWRRRAGLTQEDLAKEAKVSRATVIRYESGVVSKRSEVDLLLTTIISHIPNNKDCIGFAETLDQIGFRSIDSLTSDDASKIREWTRRAHENWEKRRDKQESTSELRSAMGLIQRMAPADQAQVIAMIKGFALAKGIS